MIPGQFSNFHKINEYFFSNILRNRVSFLCGEVVLQGGGGGGEECQVAVLDGSVLFLTTYFQA